MRYVLESHVADEIENLDRAPTSGMITVNISVDYDEIRREAETEKLRSIAASVHIRQECPFPREEPFWVEQP